LETTLDLFVGTQLALPNDHRAPFFLPQGSGHAAVTRFVSLDLRAPKFNVRRGDSTAAASMTMPETTMNKYHLATRREY
jgi:hypothetical protein